MNSKAIDMAAGSAPAQLYDMVVRELRSRAIAVDGAILDVGCGHGTLITRLRAAGYGDLCGCDALESPKALPATTKYVRVDLNDRVPFPSDRFDVVCSIEVIEHLENPRAHVRELHRVCKPGGLVILSTPNTESLLSKASFLARGHFNYFGDADYPAHITPLLPIDLRRIFAETRFAQFSHRFSDWGRIVKTTKHWQEVLRPRATATGSKSFSDHIFIFAKK
jgi:2-polyprenyl-3-methyl-5-hydroxy-6-metoxy-1,4-benzoquinol methylase